MNFLKETIDFLSKNNRNPRDVISVSSEKYRMSWDTFAKYADIEYDNGFGGRLHLRLNITMIYGIKNTKVKLIHLY